MYYLPYKRKPFYIIQKVITDLEYNKPTITKHASIFPQNNN